MDGIRDFLLGSNEIDVDGEIEIGTLTENSLIANSQLGFRKRRSCLTNLLDFYDDDTHSERTIDCKCIIVLISIICLLRD